MSDMPALRATDPEIHRLIALETRRQDEFIRLIPSENYASAAVMEATGSILNNKYSEGYPGKRYYEGQEYVDQVETLAIERAKKLFGMQHANVQPYSGSPANQAVYLALAKPGDPVMGLGLPFGGHLTHGWGVNFSGIVYKSSQYDVDPETHRVDLNRVESLARQTRPKLIYCGGTALSAHVGLRGLCDDREGRRRRARRRHRAHCGPHRGRRPSASVSARDDRHDDDAQDVTRSARRHDPVGRDACQGDRSRGFSGTARRSAQSHDGRDRGRAARGLDQRLPPLRPADRQERQGAGSALGALGFRLISGGTDNHLILIDVTPRGITGKPAARALHEAGIECNYNTIPFDPRKPFDPSGLRIGTPSITSRGMVEKDMEPIAVWIDRVLKVADDADKLHKIRAEIAEFCKSFPAPGIRV